MSEKRKVKLNVNTHYLVATGTQSLFCWYCKEQ